MRTDKEKKFVSHLCASVPHLWLIIFLALFWSVPPIAVAQTESGAAKKVDPSNPDAPVADVEAVMRTAFAELGDSDAEVRDAARATLMGVHRRYLPTLQKIVETNRPLLPSQAAVLRPI